MQVIRERGRVNGNLWGLKCENFKMKATVEQMLGWFEVGKLIRKKGVLKRLVFCKGENLSSMHEHKRNKKTKR